MCKKNMSFVWGAFSSFFWKTLKYLGLYGKNARILFLGLDNAGKTTLMHLLATNRVGQYTPTRNPTTEEMQLGGNRFCCVDLGGHKAARVLWKDYYIAVDAIVFLIDASDHERVLESKRELDGVLLEDSLADVPVAVLGNKIDIEGALSEVQLREMLGLYESRTRPLEIFMCCVVERQGYGRAIQWLASYIKD